ncbi:hypothetical protein [Melittangium boletus]|uniref:Tetratricopeptide repeat domain protein n=1 Tax=Melittangium boletus DSM 14713 TaxID=1294270 RepID=A0A250IFB1_9BACT|nr:hypothetical protein [Melittangium boletus]ATB29928.1 tetratricopeptide repeat domain protein [Melittangium boletus DSM 14713]
MHSSPRELQQLLSEARSLELGSARQLQLLEEIRTRCPAFVPALLLASRAELWSQDDSGQTDAVFNQVERMLHDAVDASGRSPEALMGLARFMSVVRASPEAAEALYREASNRTLELLEESWSGLIEALGEQEKTDEATRIAGRARQLFPESKQLADAHSFAKLGPQSI